MKRNSQAIVVLALFALLASGCSSDSPTSGESGTTSDNMASLTYPSFPETPDDGNSWDHVPDGTDVTIDWYVDVASWNAPTGLDQVSQIIKQKTGISVNFDTPVTDDGQKLATMIAGGDLPDVISIPTSQTQTITGLAQQGYAYDMNTLAQKWAPSLFDNLPQDVWNWWQYGNGKTYGIPNHYYSYDDIPAGEKLQPNGGMMVRQDIFNAWQDHVESNLKGLDGKVSYTSLSGVSKTIEWQGYITTPEGFKEAALWAMQRYGSTLSTGLQLAQFGTNGSASLNWLAQFFAVPFEDDDGQLIYDFTSQAYKNMLLYMNDLYRAGIISPANFTQNYDGAGGVVAGGKAFATLVTPQDYQFHFLTARDSGFPYVSLYITNENGDAPILQDIRGYGYLFNMITTDSARPDLIIKLFDFLTSKEGQRLVALGPEGVTWNWTDGLDSDIVFTQQYLTEKASSSTAKYGLLGFDLLINWQYYDNVQPKTNNGKSSADLFRTNLKRPLSPYAYDLNALNYVVDATDSRFQQFSNNLTRIQTTLGTLVPRIIKAASQAAAITEYNGAVTAITARGLELVATMSNEAFQAAKTKLGIERAWPPFQEGYVSPLDRTQPNGDLTRYRTY
jgi:putative aldouronate transport system substrate-binding protein